MKVMEDKSVNTDGGDCGDCWCGLGNLKCRCHFAMRAARLIDTRVTMQQELNTWTIATHQELNTWTNAMKGTL
jgi:hypothetical protein